MSEASEASGYEASEMRTQPKGPRFQVEFTDDGQATGQYRAKYTTIVEKVARTHCPPIYKDWAEVPILTKDDLWKDVLKKDSPTGEVSRTQGYVATHTRTDGSFINTEARQSIVIGRDGRGRVRGLGGGVIKTVYHVSAPYKIAQRENRACESSELGYEAIMARLDEANKARKILKDEVADLK
ncbi:hypothetical protein IFM89_000831 [Coptis chinensis]|uniref:Uncharacterized protein n=1 Tax=Coptis chinensis TaxID=261450 RepID=A0A835IW42_9MAGN|nr:hypothetical protein IFM89_000831 [Coptis chinensis]